jgi:hypothetical protein
VVAQEVCNPIQHRVSANNVAAGRTTSALSGRQRDSPSLRGGEPSVTGMTFS